MRASIIFWVGALFLSLPEICGSGTLTNIISPDLCLKKSDNARAVTLELTVRVLVYFIKSYCFGDFTGAHGERPAKVGAR